MKILFLGHYREKSGWGHAGQELITAFHEVGADIVARPVVLNGGAEITDAVLKCEAKSVRDCDAVIQNLLPHHMVLDRNFKKCIGLPFIDSYMSPENFWLSYLENMDEIWVSSDHLKRTRLLPKLRNIKVPTNLNKYNVNYITPKIHSIYDNFTFYFIGEINKRKNISDIIKAYYLEFTKNETVSLVLKVNKFGYNEQQVLDMVNSDIRKIAESMKLYPNFEDYPIVTIISNDLPDEAIYGLHQMFDCYVSTAHSEAHNLPLFDAVGFQNQIVTTNVPTNTWNEQLIDIYEDNIYGMTDTFQDQFTSRDRWSSPYMSSIREKMREKFNNGKIKVKRDLSEFSYKECGENMMSLVYE